MRPPRFFVTHLPTQWIAWVVGIGLAVSLGVGLLGQAESGPPARWNHFFFDNYLKLSANGERATRSIVVDIDDMSLAAGGQWPWPRYRMAELLQGIAAAQPAAIGLDILFAEPDRTSLDTIQKAYKRDFGIDLGFTGASPEAANNDAYLGHVLAQLNVVGARYFYFDHESTVEPIAREAFRIIGQTQKLTLPIAPGVLDNTDAIASRLRYTGFLNNRPDEDGMLRRVPLLIAQGGTIHPHMALATYMRAHGLDTAEVVEDVHGLQIRVGRRAIPISRDGFAWLRFNGAPALYPSVSALALLRGETPPEVLRGKVVFVGASAAALNDLHSTIFDPQSPGVKTHSALVESLADGRFVRVPDWAGDAILTFSVVTGLLIIGMFIILREPWQLFVGTAALVVLLLGSSVSLFNAGGLFVSPAAPVLTAALLFTLFTTVRFAAERNRAHAWYRKLANAQQVTMASMAAVAETRDPETGAHIKRTQHYVKCIAEQLRRMGYYADLLTPEYIDLLFVSAPLHDIGKVGVPDNILLKPGPLSPAEFEIMKKHAEYGREIIHSTAEKIEGDNFLIVAGEIAASHHEKWDGTGYPLGLEGHAIPLAGRIMAVADVYDALISRRCYKLAFPHAHAMELMREKKGRIFDPVVFEAFLEIEDRILEIAARYRDDNELVMGDR